MVGSDPCQNSRQIPHDYSFIKDEISTVASDIFQIGEHENKFLIQRSSVLAIRSWLDRKCLADPHYAQGRVSSIYFDTKDYRFLHEKIASDFLKTKVRLRWYSRLDDNTLLPKVFLEIKNKTGSARIKNRIITNWSSDFISSCSLADPDLLSVNLLLKSSGDVRLPVVFPVIEISYRRFRYIEPHSGARLSLDTDISSLRRNTAPNCRRAVQLLPVTVFECKGKTGNLPEWLHQITAFGAKKTAFSKYLACMSQ